MKKTIIALSVSAALVFAAQASFAAGKLPTVAGSVKLNYSATIISACTALSVSPAAIDLGTYSSDQATNVTGLPGGTVTVDCPAGTQYYIMIDAGANDLPGPPPVRTLTGVTNVLPYDIRNNGAAVVGDAIAALPAHVGASYGAMTFDAQPITGVIAGGIQNYPLTVDLLFTHAAKVLTAAESVTDNPVVAVVW